MNTYYCIAKVNKINYLTKIEADGCQAYDYKAMTTETFRSEAIIANPIGYFDLVDIIETVNEEIRKEDEKEKRIDEIEKQLRKLSEELATLKNS